MSIGIERLMAMMEATCKGARQSETEVLVASIGGLLKERLQLCGELWKNGVKVNSLPFSPAASSDFRWDSRLR